MDKNTRQNLPLLGRRGTSLKYFSPGVCPGKMFVSRDKTVCFVLQNFRVCVIIPERHKIFGKIPQPDSFGIRWKDGRT